METIEINAGAWYLRALRADERMDDRPALTSLGVDDADYVSARAADWNSDRLYSWAVCEPTTAEMVAEVRLDPATGGIESRARDDYPGSTSAEQEAVAAVRRFADAMLA
ncbi:hypothetical protein [Mycobacteroides chelonae]|uniref:hypothetical protein n=1 Tax=Mycobacteroides chelonae TaxID=1774 RepID=UPI0007A0EE38|nr:hypothetical protein [Mycobacteroides chelonae]AMW21171.1 hypothetical protein Chelonae_p3420 [Mycobacterium sp. QIA-37]AYM43289.1 hypothetical protein DYE20_18655 [[Mycobacterium] chelonae subsp. gwanakae]OHU14643.1 hypothetical protein BKG75_05280 [Mycobacteroides chelonae]GLE57526.1 hypothetical protein NJBCHELONAE_28350 [Mycobacteroides chelonae]